MYVCVPTTTDIDRTDNREEDSRKMGQVWGCLAGKEDTGAMICPTADTAIGVTMGTPVIRRPQDDQEGKYEWKVVNIDDPDLLHIQQDEFSIVNFIESKGCTYFLMKRDRREHPMAHHRFRYAKHVFHGSVCMQLGDARVGPNYIVRDVLSSTADDKLCCASITLNTNKTGIELYYAAGTIINVTFADDKEDQKHLKSEFSS